MQQDEYPVTYFFYGTLTDPDFLVQLLCLPEEEIPVLKPAHITHGILRTWRGKYKALVDGAPGDVVDGFAYEITTREREEAMRVYETEIYEVVRCGIFVEGEGGGWRKGLTSRFVREGELT